MITVSLHNLLFDGGSVQPVHEGGFVELSVSGHALFDAKGRDILCAAISALSQTMVRSIEVIGGISQEYRRGEGVLSTRIAHSTLEDEKKNSLHPDRFVFNRGY